MTAKSRKAFHRVALRRSKTTPKGNTEQAVLIISQTEDGRRKQAEADAAHDKKGRVAK